MKRLFCILSLLAFLLCGCDASGQRIKEPVTFYYVLDEYQYGAEPMVFAPEEREAAGHRDDLNYLLALYMIGPSAEGLRSPFPQGTQVQVISQSKVGLMLRLSDTSETMSDVDFTRACACLTLTCLDLIDGDRVTVLSGQRSVTMARDTLILYDDTIVSEEET